MFTKYLRDLDKNLLNITLCRILYELNKNICLVLGFYFFNQVTLSPLVSDDLYAPRVI